MHNAIGDIFIYYVLSIFINWTDLCLRYLTGNSHTHTPYYFIWHIAKYVAWSVCSFKAQLNSKRIQCGLWHTQARAFEFTCACACATTQNARCKILFHANHIRLILRTKMKGKKWKNMWPVRNACRLLKNDKNNTYTNK